MGEETEYEIWVDRVSWTKRNPTSWEERERERESRHRSLIFFHVHLVVLNCASFRVLSSPLYIRAPTFYVITSRSQLTFKPKLSAYLHLVSEEWHIRFRWFTTSADDWGPPFFFKSFLITIVIYPRRTTNVLAWLTIGQMAVQ